MLLEEIKKIDSSENELIKFGRTVGGVFLLLGVILSWFSVSRTPYILIGAGALLILCTIKPVLLKPLHKIWMALAVILGWISTRIILFILYYLVITPIRLISMIFGKEFLPLKPDKKAETYWNYRNKKEFNPLDYEKQF